MRRRPLCEISMYGHDPQCVRQGLFATFVRSRHDGKVHEVDVGARVKGSGMDMVYDVVDSLSHALYGKPNMIKSRRF